MLRDRSDQPAESTSAQRLRASDDLEAPSTCRTHRHPQHADEVSRDLHVSAMQCAGSLAAQSSDKDTRLDKATMSAQ